MKTIVVLSIFFIHIALCRDFYVGMFKKNDLLMASDTLYKERRPYSKTVAMYGRLFKCAITYFRIVDRLGQGAGPTTEITRGGLQHKYVVLRITSGYNLPLSVNIYVGCENKYNFTTSNHIVRPTRPTKKRKVKKSPKANDTNNDKPDLKPDSSKPDDAKPDDAKPEDAKPDGEDPSAPEPEAEPEPAPEGENTTPEAAPETTEEPPPN